MKYKCKPGVVLVKICGVRLLIPTLSAFEDCPDVIKLTLPAFMIWSLVFRGKSEEDMIEVFQMLTKKPIEEVKTDINKILSLFVQKGVLIEEDSNE